MKTPVFSGKAFEKLQARLKKNNAEFKKLSKKEQRVQIAKDVIAQLNTKEIKAAHCYFDYSMNANKKRWEPSGQTLVSEAAGTREPDVSEVVSQLQCDVCGIGSLFVASVKRNDKLALSDFTGDRGEETSYLSKWFSDDQLDLVETYFERDEYGELCDIKAPPKHVIIRQKNDKKRLVMIMENIISNGGKFDPKKGKWGDPEAVKEHEKKLLQRALQRPPKTPCVPQGLL